MSGFEIVGVVLGALPLIIEAVDRVKPRLEAFRHYKSKVDLLIVNFNSQCTRFRNTARKLQTAASRDRVTLEFLLARAQSGSQEMELLGDFCHCHDLIKLIDNTLNSIADSLARITGEVRVLQAKVVSGVAVRPLGGGGVDKHANAQAQR